MVDCVEDAFLLKLLLVYCDIVGVRSQEERTFEAEDSNSTASVCRTD